MAHKGQSTLRRWGLLGLGLLVVGVSARRWGLLGLGLLVVGVSALWFACQERDWWGAAEPRTLVIHPISYSNVAIFLAAHENEEQFELRFVPDPTKHLEILQSEDTDRAVIAVTPFSNALIAASQNEQVRIIGGAGMNGLSIIAAEAANIDELSNKKIGTSRGDSLELFMVEAMGDRSYDPIYFDDPFVAIQAIKNNEIDAVTHVEPFASKLVQGGMNRVLTSRDLWGDHPDAILMSTAENIRLYPDALKSALSAFAVAAELVRNNPQQTAEVVAPLYEPLDAATLAEIIPDQEPRIDIRGYQDFFKARYETLKMLGYVSALSFPARAFDYSLLPAE